MVGRHSSRARRRLRCCSSPRSIWGWILSRSVRMLKSCMCFLLTRQGSPWVLFIVMESESKEKGEGGIDCSSKAQRRLCWMHREIQLSLARRGEKLEVRPCPTKHARPSLGLSTCMRASRCGQLGWCIKTLRAGRQFRRMARQWHLRTFFRK